MASAALGWGGYAKLGATFGFVVAIPGAIYNTATGSEGLRTALFEATVVAGLSAIAAVALLFTTYAALPAFLRTEQKAVRFEFDQQGWRGWDKAGNHHSKSWEIVRSLKSKKLGWRMTLRPFGYHTIPHRALSPDQASALEQLATQSIKRR
ncbi:MAG: hypothetical protein AAF830_08990 [Pseudomonadota bacterium]